MYADNAYNNYYGSYGEGDTAFSAPEITFSVNQNSAQENYFYSIDYEGDPTWSVKNIKTNTQPSGDLFADQAKNIDGFNQRTDSIDSYLNASIFYKKGLQYCAALQNDLFVKENEIYLGTGVEGLDVTGLKGNYLQMTFFIERDPTKNSGITRQRAELANVKTSFNPL